MGIDLIWQDENGNQLDQVDDSKSLLSEFLDSAHFEDTVCIQFIDLYGDTIFNQIQIPQLISELNSLKFEIENEKIVNQIDRILNLANKANGEVHTYLKFYGD